jgi:CDP-glucose 4,6-dehydratase
MFDNIYKDKTVIVTGHTGFKGSWITNWLCKLGANVVGISLDIPTIPSLFEVLQLDNKIKDYRINITDLDKLKKIVIENEPDFVFHLAAQPIVSESYSNPINTLMSNVIGTANILESIRSIEKKCICIIITSDKCYENVEWMWGYKENDRLGGKDIYSGSKAAAEIIYNSYYNSFLSKKSNLRTATVRAGNVIGGGDWAKDRIIPDSVRAWSRKASVEIRNPKSTRPWQHVLEPISGYLTLAQCLFNDNKYNGENFNFGPKPEDCITVEKLIYDISSYWDFEQNFEVLNNTGLNNFHEAGLLKLNCEKSYTLLSWEPTLTYEKTVEFTSKWYFNYYQNKIDIKSFTTEQIENYEKIAFERKIKWAQ